MSDSADELLDELEQLEHATEDMRQEVDNASEKKKQLNNSDSSHKIDAAMLTLEAAKTSQTAASHSHSAAEASIKLAHDQKAQIMDLSDSNIAWRQALRSASNDLTSAKNSVAIMMGVSLAFSAISIGIMGFLYYNLNNKYEILKGDVLDIIGTENTLFNKSITLKVDQLSSLIEALAADIQKLNISGVIATSPPPSSIRMDNNHVAPLVDLNNELNSETTNVPNKAPIELIEKTEAAKENQPLSETTDTPSLPTMAETQTTKEVVKIEKVFIEPSQQQIEATLKPLSDMYQQKLVAIEEMVNKIIAEQQKIQSTTMSQSAKVQKTPVQTGLTKDQVAKLDAIAAEVAQQGKLLKTIQATLKKQKQVVSSSNPTSAKSLKRIEGALWRLNKQMKAIQTQQSSVQSKVKNLQSTTTKLEKKVGESKPYSYRSKNPVALPPEDQLLEIINSNE